MPDAAHVRAAMARFNQVGGVSQSDRRAAYDRIMRRALELGIEPRKFEEEYGPQHNPATFTKKGERLYEHIKEGYGHDPRAKEIAARTVYKISHSTPGLVKKKYQKNPYGSFAHGGRVRGGQSSRFAKKVLLSSNPYVKWIAKQTKADLRKLERALLVLIESPIKADEKKDAKAKLFAVQRELNQR